MNRVVPIVLILAVLGGLTWLLLPDGSGDPNVAGGDGGAARAGERVVGPESDSASDPRSGTGGPSRSGDGTSGSGDRIAAGRFRNRLADRTIRKGV